MPELNKWAACLKFRLEVQGDTCPILKLTGRLQDDGCRQSDNQGVLEIKASRLSSNGASLTLAICRM